MPSIQTNDIHTYYDRRGDGPPLVFIHGAILDHAQWEPQLERLSESYTTIAYDVRGHGRTGGSAKESYSIDLFGEDVLCVELGTERTVRHRSPDQQLRPQDEGGGPDRLD